MKYLCTISYKDAPAKYAMNNEIVEAIGGTEFHRDRIWVRRVVTGEEFRACRDELWPIDDDMAMAIMAWKQES